jgi:hypothetical protein
MTLSEGTVILKKLRSTPWKFQRTFLTPMQSLQEFVTAIISANQQINSGCVTIEQAVFEPAHLINLLTSYSIPPRYEPGVSITATGQKEVEKLLSAIFSDWIDFFFLPEPTTFFIYADHDEYTTLFVHTSANLNRTVKALTDGGFTLISDYERRF